MSRSLIFVYNANSGLFNALTDTAHKLLSPATYSCNLCSLTHSGLGMRKEWKQFVENLGRPVEFLHADEFKKRYKMKSVQLPLMLDNNDGAIVTLLDADAINACKSIEELKLAISKRIA